MKTLLGYDFLYLKRTNKFIIIPAIAILFAILSPLTAKYLPEILSALLGSEGMSIALPDVSVMDSYTQYIGNLYELFLIVIVFMGVSIFMREKNKGEYPLIFSKPINRTKYLLSKYTSFSLLILITLIVSGLIFTYYTYYLFDEVSIIIIAQISLLFFLYTEFILSIALVFSIWFESYAGASVTTFVLYIIMSILGNFDKSLLDYLPGRMTQRIAEIIMGLNEATSLWATSIITLLITGLFIGLSIRKFKELDI